MTSAWLGIETSLRGLLAHQAALDVTSHNVANASTPGYSRQQAVLETTDPLVMGSQSSSGSELYMGQGVDIASIQRIRDTFSDLQYRAQNMALGQHTTDAQFLGQIEDTLAEPSDSGISNVLSQFWSSWDNLANNPENPATRQGVINQGQLLASRINELSSNLSTIQGQAQQQYNAEVGPTGDVLAAAQEIAQLNTAIKAAQGAGANPNDLLDRRDADLDKLSGLAQVSVTDMGDGQIQVNFGDAAQPLVQGGTVTWPQTLTNPGGTLGSLLNLANPTTGTIAGYINSLDGFANQLATSVNLAYNGTFFSGTTAATLAVAETSATLKASDQPGPPPGANEVALAVSGLRGGSADTSYGGMVAQIGADSRDAQNQQQTYTALTQAADNRRQSVAGVSMDEELSNMIRFQRGYQAAARTMTTLDQMLDTLINHTGSVGL